MYVHERFKITTLLHNNTLFTYKYLKILPYNTYTTQTHQLYENI